MIEINLSKISYYNIISFNQKLLDYCNVMKKYLMIITKSKNKKRLSVKKYVW